MPDTIHIATMKGCGHCENAVASLKGDSTFNVVVCRDENKAWIDPSHPDAWVCRNVRSFPTFKTEGSNDACAVGFVSKSQVIDSCQT